MEGAWQEFYWNGRKNKWAPRCKHCKANSAPNSDYTCGKHKTLVIEKDTFYEASDYCSDNQRKQNFVY